MNTELKTCPFCDSDLIIPFLLDGCEQPEGFLMALGCDNCGCHGPGEYVNAKQKEDAEDYPYNSNPPPLPSILIKAWNKRKSS
jgi:hypothetical protein